MNYKEQFQEIYDEFRELYPELCADEVGRLAWEEYEKHSDNPY